MDSVAWPDPAREWPSCLSLCLFPFHLLFSPDLDISFPSSVYSPSPLYFFLFLFSFSSFPFSCFFFPSPTPSLHTPMSFPSTSSFTIAYLLTLLNKPDCPMLYPLWCTKDHASPVQYEQPGERTHLAQGCFHIESKQLPGSSEIKCISKPR